VPFVDLSGNHVRYREAGGGGSPVLFIHGAGASSAIWLPALHRVAPRQRAVAFDLPGHGRSTGACRSFDDWLAATTGTAAALCLGPSVLVGHSLGGLVAQAAALAYPDKVAGLVLVTTAARLAVSSRLLDRIENDWLHWPDYVQEMSYSPDTAAEIRRRSAGLAFTSEQAQTLADFLAAGGFDARPRLGEIRCPTLVIAGTKDQMVPLKFCASLAEGIPGAQLVELAAGHFPMHEQPDAFATALLDFLGRV